MKLKKYKVENVTPLIAVTALIVITALAVIKSFDHTSASIDTEPLGAVGSGLKLPTTTTICLEVSRELDAGWPVFDAAYNWNKNGLNLFTTGEYPKCSGVVLINQSDTKQWYGNTEFYSKDIINVQLSITTPPNKRSAVVCHELGHVLGLPHSQGDGSCMDSTVTNNEPTQKDLATVSHESWRASQAAKTIGHH